MSTASAAATSLTGLTPSSYRRPGSRARLDDYLCSAITGVAAPQRSKVPATAHKIPFFGGREVSRAAAALITVDDWADHYSQVAIDLRLNGLLPPTAKRRAQ